MQYNKSITNDHIHFQHYATVIQQFETLNPISMIIICFCFHTHSVAAAAARVCEIFVCLCIWRSVHPLTWWRDATTQVLSPFPLVGLFWCCFSCCFRCSFSHICASTRFCYMLIVAFFPFSRLQSSISFLFLSLALTTKTTTMFYFTWSLYFRSMIQMCSSRMPLLQRAFMHYLQSKFGLGFKGFTF